MLNFIARLMKTPQALFIWSIITKWYMLIMIPTIMATYYVFKGLHDAGVFALIEEFTIDKFHLVARIAKDCTQEILNLKYFFLCVNNTK